MKAQRVLGLLGMCGAAGVAALAGPAWACSQSPIITTAASSVVAGTEFLVDGTQWDAPTESGPVELRWNAKVGAPVASAAGMSFSVPVRVPAGAGQGQYVVNAQQRSLADDSVRWQRSLVVTVTVPAAAPLEEEDVSTPVTEPSADPVTDVSPVDPGAPVATVPVTAGPATPSPVASNPLPSGSGGSGPAGPGSAGAGANPSPPPRPGVSHGPVTQTLERLPVVGGRAAAVGPDGPPVGTHSAGRPIGADERDLVPADPASAWVQPAGARPAPSLFDPVDAFESHGSSSAPLGAALVGLGLMAIVGIGIVLGQRRLALVRRGSSSY